MKRVVLAMSGGVDSSAAAFLLLEAGYDVVGVFMRHGEESVGSCAVANDEPNPLLPILQGRLDHKQGCCSASDAMDARRVADRLAIPFYALDLQADFARIVHYFVDEYTHGRTPNPCVQCNNWLKFGRLFDYADSIDAEFVATGHYARLEQVDGQPALLRGVDARKDQSYVLAGIDRALLPRMLLPVGGFLKPQIRELAAKAGLKVADKRDSQEICFVTSGKHGQFVRARSDKNTAGNFINANGEFLGAHAGIENFTIGQRKGLGIALGEPHFVIRINQDTNEVTLGTKDALDCDSLTATDANWLTDLPTSTFSSMAQIRYNSSAVPAMITPDGAHSFHVKFTYPATGVAPGQLCVVYRDERVLGGGWIR
ncbi:MAG: tRNA 2-thiouridine(34) synthase MnmA [Planctomycetales bacterium]|nr:tRNA 2-thiouridine(34) synthase MnmA [Planctomycetales bacterium]